MTNNNTNTFGTQIRKSPFIKSTINDGCTAFSVYNHMYIPRSIRDPVKKYCN
jgi:aminomethyltransferase